MFPVPSRDGAPLHPASDQQHGQERCRVCFGFYQLGSSDCFICQYVQQSSAEAVNVDVADEMLEMFLLWRDCAPIAPPVVSTTACPGAFRPVQSLSGGV